ncbi:MAG TPA: radical SAM protein [Planctomycetota bacterium]|jgi:hypothetical protein|nr:radical SAM protein [Planctomycetota bacterium]
MGTAINPIETLRELESVAAEFADLPPEIVVKEDCLRNGVRFSPRALSLGHAYARKSYFIFSFDRQELSEVDDASREQAPEEIALFGGPRGFRRVVVSVRLNAQSPWCVDVTPEERLVLRCGTEEFCEVEFSARPPYYGDKLADGTPITEVAPSIEWGYLLYLTVFRMCQYFGKEEECQFCDINRNFKQQRDLGRPYFAVKPKERLLEALDRVVASGARAKAYTITGGSVTSRLEGQDEASFYTDYARAIEDRFPGRWIGKMVVQALPKSDVQRIRDAGIRIYHPNYEIWDPRLFSLICPGKARYVGRDEWIRRILDSAEVFPPECVIPNFVAGIEMSAPHGFKTEEEAWNSTGEGLSYFMSRGISPRFTSWCPEPLSVLGRSSGPASLRYHVGLVKLWRDIHRSFGLPVPPGYGEAGIGRAVFSVSSFMDAIPDGAPRVEFSSLAKQS